MQALFNLDVYIGLYIGPGNESPMITNVVFVLVLVLIVAVAVIRFSIS